jgi:hypothetical protein
MSNTKKNPTTPRTPRQTLKIGSRVRCTDDGMAGRIVWANGTSVKIQWETGEQVTWRRDALADKPIEILDTSAAGNESLPNEASSQAAAEDVATGVSQTAQQQMPCMVAQGLPTNRTVDGAPSAQEQTQAATEGLVSQPALSPASPSAAAPADSVPTSSVPAQPKQQRKATEEPQNRRLSALDAAAQVLAEEGRAMTCQEMIEVMAAKGYRTSPTGATPHSTLYSAILREQTTKGNAARFLKVARGKFARTTAS